MPTEIFALTPEQLEISPGVGAFAVFFVLAIAIVLLVLNMSKHLRKVDRHRIEQEMRAEYAEKRRREAGEEGQSGPDDDGPTSPAAGPH